MIFPIYVGIRVTGEIGAGGIPDELKAVVAYLPMFLMSQLVIADWLDFLKIALFQTIGIKFFDSVICIVTFMKILAMYTFAFSCIEKVRKESYVVSNTNAKTKKILLGLLNQ
jgi:hypothetical protein